MNDPAFLFYPGDYLRDTQCLSEKTQVAYDRIMCEHMRNICISQQQLNFFTKKLTDDEKAELLFLLTKKDEGYFISWVAESIEKRREYSESRRNNRKKIVKKEQENEKTYEKDMKTYDSHMENENENENENEIEDINKEEKNEQFPLKTAEEKKEKSCAKKERLSPPPDVNELIAFCASKFDSKYINNKTVIMFSKLLKSYSKEQIKQAIENGKKDEFWTINFLSPLKLQTQNKEGVYYIDKFLTLKSDGNNKGYNQQKQPEHLHNGSRFEQSVTKDNF